ncbi:MAG TPA: YkgJ family cysteine cluster protein, partial [Thermoanaerobaculia bacterium]|nr:YkgJ family cysteine cluster protein [Thermoanaerobaculia bacterium]
MISAFETASRLWDEASTRTSPGEVACRAGCFGCCIGLFEISLAEAVLVRSGGAPLPDGVRADVLSRARRIVAESARAFPGDAERGLLDPDRTEAADDAYFEVVADRACPMLELPSGRCRIYAARPITCRTYGFAWAKDGAIIHPPCGLNLPGAPAERQLRASIDIGRIDEAGDVAAAIAEDLGREAEVESTIAHAGVGSACGPRL